MSQRSNMVTGYTLSAPNAAKKNTAYHDNMF